MRRYWWISVSLLLASCAAPAALRTSEVTPASQPSTPTTSVVTPVPQSPTPTASVAAPTAPPTASKDTPSSEAATEQRIEVPARVPAVDVTRHSVPLDQILFDTFQPVNRAVPLSQASPELIQQLRDAIPPIHNPKYQPATEAIWLNDGDVVIGYAAGDQAWAYPVRILNFHEIINDTLAGEPVLVSYCPLCYSGIVFSRRLGDDVLVFGNTSALYESDMVMLDYATGSYWWQVAGQAIVGPLTGETLTVLPSTTITWGEWRKLHPGTLVLSRDTGYPRNYDRDPFVDYADFVDSGRFAFPVSDAARDQRLSPAVQVLAVKVGDESRAYPVAALGRAAIMDTIGGQTIVVFTDPDSQTGTAYQPVAGGQELTFEMQNGEFTDRETGSIWDLAGRAIGGPLKGAQLPAIPSKTAFWFAVVAAEPEISVYEGGGKG